MTYSIDLPDDLIDLDPKPITAVYTAYKAMSPGYYGVHLEHIIKGNSQVYEPKEVSLTEAQIEDIEVWISSRHDFWEINGLSPDEAYASFVDK